MRSGQLTRELSYISTVPPGTAADCIAEMQAAGMCLKGTRGRGGGVELSTTCKINGLLSTALSHPRGISLADSVREIRSLPVGAARRTHRLSENTEDGVRGVFEFMCGLSIRPLHDLGQVLDAVLHDLESGRFKAWAAGDRIWLTLQFSNHNRSAMFVLERADKKEGIYLSFGEDEAFNEDRGWVTRHTQIQLKVFERLASA
ncbi:hypothetical protein ABIG06_006883 [Bradyrhizobium sp. USDA 326]